MSHAKFLASLLSRWLRKLWREDNAPRPSRPRGGAEAMLLVPINPARSRYAFLVFVICLGAILLKAFWLQGGIDTDFLQRQGAARVNRVYSVPAERGQIVDRNGVVLASSLPAIDLWMTPEEIAQASSGQLDALASLLDLSRAGLDETIASRRDRKFAYLRRQLDPDVARAALGLGLPGLHENKTTRRNYPDGEISAHVVGFVDVDGKGREGIEMASDGILAGRPGSRRVTRDRLGRVIDDLWLSQPEPGSDVILSLDARLQFIAHNALRDAVERHQAAAGAVVAVDVRSGEILAMSNWPSYDPNKRRGARRENIRNRVLTDVFEPGSTMKPFAVAEALELGLVRPDTLVDTAPGKLTIGDRTISDTHNNGLITVSQVVSRSSNIGTTKIALDIDPRVLWETYHRLGFGEAPRVDFPGAVSGRLRPGASWRPIEQATISYGHGVSVSLMQLVRAYTALARNGDVIDLTFRRADREAVGTQVFRPEVARQMRAMMIGTVQVGGTARRVSVEGYTVAGKTGTANKVENGEYVDKYVASFVGMAPASQPRVLVAVTLDEPTSGSHFGGIVAAPVFNDVAAGALRLLGVHPDDPQAGTAAGFYVRSASRD